MLAAADGIPVITYDVGVGPLRTGDGRLMTRAVFDLAAANTVRDTGSAALLQDWGLPADAVRVSGDPAIGVDLPEVDPAAVAPAVSGEVAGAVEIGSGGPVLGVSVRQWEVDDPAAWNRALAAAVDAHLDRTGGRAVFVACHRGVAWPLTDDAAAANDVIGAMAHADRATVVAADTPWSERAALLGRCDAVLAMRYHAALFAMRAGVPTVGLSYDPKVGALFADWGLPDRCLELSEAAADPQRIVDLLAGSVTDSTAAGVIDPGALGAATREDVRGTIQLGGHRMLRAEHAAPAAVAGVLAAGGAGPRPPSAAVRDLLERMATTADQRPAPVDEALDRLARRLGVPAPRRRTVAILTNRLVDRKTGKVRVGGAERYARALAGLLVDLGLTPEFYQGGGTFTVGDFFGHPVYPIPFGESLSEFQVGVGAEFHRRTADADHVIYLMPNYASGPMRDDAIVVSHGVWWDHDLWSHLQMRTPEWLEQLERVFTRPRRVISVDTNTGNVVRSLFPAADQRLRYIPSSIDTDAFAPRDPAGSSSGGTSSQRVPLVLFPRRAETIRGSHLVGDILDRVPDPCRFAWVGLGERQQVAGLRAVAQRDPRLTVSDAAFDEMPQRYRQADVCVIPTVASEGQSLSCLEAMASGLAVVVTRVGGLPELVTDGVDGLVCEPTADSLAAAIRRLVRDPALRSRLGAEARRTALRHSHWRWRANWAAELVDLGWVDRRSAARAVPYDVINFSVINWEQRYQRPQQVAACWGRRGRRVFYVRVSRHLPPGGRPYAVTERAPGVFEVTLSLPKGTKLHFAQYPKGFRKEAMRALSALRADWGIDRAVSMVELGAWHPVATAARAQFGWPVLYDCMDDWSTFPGSDEREPLLAAERELVRAADAMTVSSLSIQQRWSAERPDAALVRNAADFDFFHRATSPGASSPGDAEGTRDPDADTPEPLADVAGPVAGFIGAVVDWFDVDLVRRVAVARPDVTFAFVGPRARISADPLLSLPNVRFVGLQPYEDMARYVRRFDVCLVPFVVGDVTASMDLVKVYEYLAQGKPVVCTPVAEMVPYSRYLYLADGPEEFVAQLDRALAEDDPDAVRGRVEMARHNSWDDRIDDLERTILPLIVGEPGAGRAGHGPAARPERAPSADLAKARAEAAGLRKKAASAHQEAKAARAAAARARNQLAKLNGSRSMRMVRRYWAARDGARRGMSEGRRRLRALRER